MASRANEDEKKVNQTPTTVVSESEYCEFLKYNQETDRVDV